MSPVIWVLTVLALSISSLACSFFSNFGQPEIPASAQVDLKPGSSRILGHFRLADWATEVSKTAYATVFEGYLAETGEREIRVFLYDGSSTQYVGALTDQLQLPGVKTLFIDFGTERCVIGWVASPSKEKLLYFHLERPEADVSRWWEGVKESSIEKNLFILPIIASDQPQLWNSVVLAAVQTRESLQRGSDGKGSYFQVEKAYSPPLDVSGFYIHISVQK